MNDCVGESGARVACGARVAWQGSGNSGSTLHYLFSNYVCYVDVELTHVFISLRHPYVVMRNNIVFVQMPFLVIA